MEPIRHAVETESADGILLNQTQPDDPPIRYLQALGVPFATHGRTSMGIAHPHFDVDNKAFDRLGVRALAQPNPADDLLVGSTTAAIVGAGQSGGVLGRDIDMVAKETIPLLRLFRRSCARMWAAPENSLPAACWRRSTNARGPNGRGLRFRSGWKRTRARAKGTAIRTIKGSTLCPGDAPPFHSRKPITARAAASDDVGLQKASRAGLSSNLEKTARSVDHCDTRTGVTP